MTEASQQQDHDYGRVSYPHIGIIRQCVLRYGPKIHLFADSAALVSLVLCTEWVRKNWTFLTVCNSRIAMTQKGDLYIKVSSKLSGVSLFKLS